MVAKVAEELDKTDPAKLAEILSLDLPAHGVWRSEELGQILQHQLSVPLGFDLIDSQETMRQAAGGAARMSFGQLLHDPSPPPQMLELTHKFAKACRGNPDGPLPPEVATVLYYAAIIVARMRCGRRISRLDDGALHEGLRWGLEQEWLDEGIRTIFKEGREYLDRGVK